MDDPGRVYDGALVVAAAQPLTAHLGPFPLLGRLPQRLSGAQRSRPVAKARAPIPELLLCSPS